MSSLRRLQFGGFCITAGAEWEDITASLQERDPPITVARSKDGVGAIQFSPAIYRSGPVPSPKVEDLRSMLSEFAERRALGEGFDSVPFTGSIFGIGLSFHSADDFVRAWYLSDGKNIMLVTYVCDWCSRLEESQECERIVWSVQFNSECSGLGPAATKSK